MPWVGGSSPSPRAIYKTMNAYTVIIARLDKDLRLVEEHTYDVQAKEARFAPSAAAIALRKDYPNTGYTQTLKVIDPNAISKNDEVGASRDSKSQSSKAHGRVRDSSSGLLGGTQEATKKPAKRGRRPKG